MTVFRPNDEPDPGPAAQAAIAASAPNAPAPSVASPAFSNDKFLQDSINELHETDAAYAKLTSEEARRQYDDLARANKARTMRQSEIQESTNGAKREAIQADYAQRNQVLNRQAQDVGARVDAFAVTEPGFANLSLEEQVRRMPQGLSADFIRTMQELDNFNRDVGSPTWEQIKDLPAQQFQPPPAAQQQPAPQPTPYEPTQANSLADYWADEQAKTLGFSNKQEMIQWGQDMTQFRQQMQERDTVTEFFAKCPDYPNSDEANNAITAIIEANGWQYNAGSLEAAHSLAVQRHLYQPLTPYEQQASVGAAPESHRQAPPPMVRSDSPETAFRQADVHSMPLDQLRKLAIQQELEAKGSLTHR